MKHYSRSARRPKERGREPESHLRMPAAGQRIGSIRITLYAAEYELALLQPGSVSGRDPRSDWIALEDGRVMSVAAATAELAKTITKRMTKRERSAL